MKHIAYTVSRKLFRLMTGDKTKPYFKRIDVALERYMGSAYYQSVEKVKKNLKYGLSVDFRESASVKVRRKQIQWGKEECAAEKTETLVSVVVPGYNHARYLNRRLRCIYEQTYRNFEVILLDDASTDNSAAIMQSYADRYPERTRFYRQKVHSGNVYGQWMKGIAKAKGDLIWIAESDDYCTEFFLEKMIRGFRYESVRIAFARSIFVQNGKKVGSTEEYLSALTVFDWNRSFVMTSHEAVRNGFADYNLIANVSSAVFKKSAICEEVDEPCRKMSLCFDWLFYLGLIRGGSISYVRNVTTYYRLHCDSTSLKIQKSPRYYREHEIVLSYIAEHYRVPDAVFDRHLTILNQHYLSLHGMNGASFCPEDEFHVARVKKHMLNRKLTVLMCIYSFQPGGGEVFPIYLANAIYDLGHTVTILDFHEGPEDRAVRSLLRSEISVVKIRSTDEMYWIIEKLGADIVHTNHAYTDEAIGCWMLNHAFHCRQVITLHGMYDLMDKAVCSRVLKTTGNSAAAYCYVADKNLEPFKENGYYRKGTENKFHKITNGAPTQYSCTVSRSDIKAGPEDFVITVASRGILEKGWRETVEAVRMASDKTSRRLILVILGDGEMRERLMDQASDTLILMGNVPNVSSYFRISDVGMLLSRFKGESYPLSVIECLQEGKPVIATDVGEIRHELMDQNHEPAGILIPAGSTETIIRDAARAICLLAEDPEVYDRYQSRCKSASAKFDMKKIAEMYLNVYRKVLSEKEK